MTEERRSELETGSRTLRITQSEQQRKRKKKKKEECLMPCRTVTKDLTFVSSESQKEKRVGLKSYSKKWLKISQIWQMTLTHSSKS